MWILPKTLNIGMTTTPINSIEKHMLFRSKSSSAQTWKRRYKLSSWLNTTFTQSPIDPKDVESWTISHLRALQLTSHQAMTPSRFASINSDRELRAIAQYPYSLRFKDKKVVSWATPTVGEGQKISNNPFNKGQRGLSNDPELRGQCNTLGLLSPRWVETLQGLPVGWGLVSWKGDI
jgi:hypothetical protein